MKRIAIQSMAAIISFVIGVCVSSMCGALRSRSTEIQPVVIDKSRSPIPVLTPADSSSLVRSTDRANAKDPIRKVDFRNYRFPGFYDKLISLTDGKQEIRRDCGGTIYTLQDVVYLDLTGDHREEALVTMEDFSGCVSSGVSYNYYIYTMRLGCPFILWRVTTGSEGLAGLKEFRLEGKELIFDVFGVSRIRGRNIVGGDDVGECCPKHFSRIKVAWNGGRFRQIDAQVFAL